MVVVTGTVITGTAAKAAHPETDPDSSGHVREEIVCPLERFLGV